MILRFPVPEEPVSTNSRIANPRSRGGAIRLTRYRVAWRDTAETYASQHPVIKRAASRGGLGESNVCVTIPFATSRHRDPSNYVGTVCKWIIDGLTNAGAWPDDGPEWVTVYEPKLIVGNEVVVEIWARTVKPA